MVITIRHYMLCTHNSKVNRLNAKYMLLEDYLFTDTIPKITQDIFPPKSLWPENKKYIPIALWTVRLGLFFHLRKVI